MGISMAAVVATIEAAAAYAGTATAAAGATTAAAGTTAAAATTAGTIASTGIGAVTAADSAAALALLPAATEGGLGTLAYGSITSSVLGGVTSAIGASKQAGAEAAAARYNAQVAGQNADQADRNAQMAGEAGEAQFNMAGQRGKAQLGAILAEQGASGVDVNSGSSIGVRQSASELAQLNALTVRSNAIKEAYGHKVQATSFRSQGALDLKQADEAVSAGKINTAATLLGTVGNAGSNFSKWKINSGNSLETF